MKKVSLATNGILCSHKADYRSLQKRLHHPGEDSRSVAQRRREISSMNRTKLLPLLLEALRRKGVQISRRVGKKMRRKIK